MALRAIFGDLSDDRTIGGSSGVGTTNITNVSASAHAAAGSSPTVSATLSDTSLSFAFGLVPGETGQTGPQGVPGPQGEPGASAVLGAAYKGTYTGTGTYGASNPNTLTFTTAPSLVRVEGPYSANNRTVSIEFTQGQTVGLALNAQAGNSVTGYEGVTCAWSNDGKTLTWYSSTSANWQCNASGYEYTYVAIGTGEIACTVEVGTVSTGAQAAVVNSGTAQQAVLDFTLPQTQTANNVQDTGGTGQIEFSLDADGKGQYRAVGAASWIPFLSGGGDAYDALDLSGALYFGTAQSDEFANNSTKTFTLTGLEAGKEYMLIPCQVLGTGTPHMWLGDHNGYTQSFSGATVTDEKQVAFWRFQRLSVTANDPTMTVRNTAGYKNRFETLVIPL